MSDTSVTRGLYQAQIISNLSPKRIYKGPDGHHWIIGVPGEVYQIKVKSLSGRIGVTVAVDGLDILEDKLADLSNPSLQVITTEYTFQGFRTDDNSTGDFIFGSINGSVAQQSNRMNSIGTIGIAAWREWPGHNPFSYATHDSNIRRPLTETVSAASMGTHIGEAKYDPVQRVEFERWGVPDILEFGYETREELIRMGIVLEHPSAFPGTATGYERYRNQ